MSLFFSTCVEVCATLIATITARQATAELAAEREGEDLRAGRLLQAQTEAASLEARCEVEATTLQALRAPPMA